MRKVDVMRLEEKYACNAGKREGLYGKILARRCRSSVDVDEE